VPKDKKLNSIHREYTRPSFQFPFANWIGCVESDPSGSEPANWFKIGGSSVHYSRVTTGNDYSDDWIAYITAVNSACLHRNGERYGECYDFYVSAYGDQEHEKKA
jgi:hypothetical protein